MVRRKNDDGATVVMERPATPEQIAARVAAADAEARKAELISDVEAWRRVVHDIAAGQEPDGKTLAAIGDLSRRLRLPPDSIARGVKAVQEERRLQGEADRMKQKIVSVKDREAELAAEIKAVEARLRELNTELGEYHSMHRGYPFAVHAVAAIKAEHPVVFAAPEHVADRLMAADSGMSLEALKAMQPAEWRADGHSSKATWGG
jgi:hypothetical protein